MEAPPVKLLFLDLETTGTDPLNDRIVEIALLDQDGEYFHTYVNPGRPIPPGATEVHGIDDRFVATYPAFEEIAVRVQGLVDGRVLVGYNSKSFDSKMLHMHLVNAGQRGIGDDHPQIDVYVLWQELEKRTLENAVKRWAPGISHTAHSALGDVRATQQVLSNMMHHYQRDAEEALRITSEADVTRWVEKKDGALVWRFGKNRGKPVREDPSYAQWVLDKDFPPALKRAVQEELLR